MSRHEIINEFEKNYPKTDIHNKKVLTVHRIVELENKSNLNYTERTELGKLKRKVKRMNYNGD